MDSDEHKHRVEAFQSDLRQLDMMGVIRKHITTGSAAVLSDAAYYDLRNEVAEHFRLHPSEVVLIGSCRTGFSLKPKKRYQPCTDVSDLDIAVVSRTQFEMYWDSAFDYWRHRRTWSDAWKFRWFLRELFKGWLWPRRLPPGREFREALAWIEFEDRLGRVRFGGVRSIGVRLYRSWDRLEAYQAIHVASCVNALARSTA